MAQILEQLFDSSVKAKLLRLFFRNPEKFFTAKQTAEKIRSKTRLVKKQIEGLHKISFLRLKKVKQGSQKTGLKPGIYFSINPNFEFYNELATLVLKSNPASKEKMLQNIKKLGRIKLALLAGIFINAENSRADLIVVGDGINRKKMAIFLSNLEAEVGREVEYSFMNTKEFKYRYDMFDRFIHDALERPHEKLVNKLRL